MGHIVVQLIFKWICAETLSFKFAHNKRKFTSESSCSNPWRCRSNIFQINIGRYSCTLVLNSFTGVFFAGFDDRIRQEIEQNICAEGGPGLDCFALPLELIARYLEQV
jgi:hypothetical protein